MNLKVLTVTETPDCTGTKKVLGTELAEEYRDSSRYFCSYCEFTYVPREFVTGLDHSVGISVSGARWKKTPAIPQSLALGGGVHGLSRSAFRSMMLKSSIETVGHLVRNVRDRVIGPSSPEL